MSGVICDSDVLIDYWDVNKTRHFATKQMIDNIIGLNHVLISAITYMELMIGVKNKEDLARKRKNLKAFNCILLNESITQNAFVLLSQYRLSHGLSIPDCLIASSAIEINLPLFTYNLKDFNFIKGLTLYNAAFTK